MHCFHPSIDCRVGDRRWESTWEGVMIEIEEGKDFSFIYVPRNKETKALIRALERIRKATCDYWMSWNEYCKTYFITDMYHYRKDGCIGHSWTFNTSTMIPRLRKLVGSLPVAYRKNH